MVIATRIFGVNGKAIGSETTEEYGSIVMDELPLNFKEVIVAASTALPPCETATFTTFIVTGVEQVLLESFKRNVSPPIDTLITWRNVLLAKKGAGGVLFEPAA
ncbi:hypothetical protein ACH5TW_01105 [Flavobacteriaceae bacterium MEBiC06508]